MAGGAASSQWPVISGDGTHVAFLTATGLVSGDTDGQLDVYSHRYVPRTGGGGPTPTPTPTPTATPADPGPPLPPPPPRAKVTLRGEAAFARGTANDLYLACTTLDLYLIDVLPAGKRVAVTGAADLRLAGQTAQILLDGKPVGSAKIGASGAFAARVKAPAKRKRAKARYQARVATAASQKLRLVRRMVATTLTRSGDNLVLRGVVNAPRARKQPRDRGRPLPLLPPPRGGQGAEGPPEPQRALRGEDQGARGVAGGALPGADEGAAARRAQADEGDVHAAARSRCRLSG